MVFHILQPICVFSVQVIAFYEFAKGHGALEMIKDGKNQYQLLQERGKLPHYGECWQLAVDRVQEGCRFLSENTQSDMALHITNCFLAMSGHEVYNCELDKKPNLRGICISSMSDRAFNVYTEFYTHTQNICWFLRGQLWQESISESTMQVGKQLKSSLSQQDLLLGQQRESLVMQEQLLSYGHSLERVLNDTRMQALTVMDEIRNSAVKHQQLLNVMSDSMGGLKSWLIGEISWFDSLLFYVCSIIVVMVLTSTARSHLARLPLFITLSLNILMERTICDRMSANVNQSQIHLLYEDLQCYIWWCRRVSVLCCTILFVAAMYSFRDYAAINNALLLKIDKQNRSIRSTLEQWGQVYSAGSATQPDCDTSLDGHKKRDASYNGTWSTSSTPPCHKYKPSTTWTLGSNDQLNNTTITARKYNLRSQLRTIQTSKS